MLGVLEYTEREGGGEHAIKNKSATREQQVGYIFSCINLFRSASSASSIRWDALRLPFRSNTVDIFVVVGGGEK